jgi:hypothetical protein
MLGEEGVIARATRLVAEASGSGGVTVSTLQERSRIDRNSERKTRDSGEGPFFMVVVSWLGDGVWVRLRIVKV